MRTSPWRARAAAVFASVAVSALAAPAIADSVPREDQLIFENISERVTTPENYNPYLPGTLKHAGLQQVGFESLFYYNYETGEMVPWQATGYEFNAGFDQVTIHLRDGVTWSDGQPFTSDDVAFTLDML